MMKTSFVLAALVAVGASVPLERVTKRVTLGGPEDLMPAIDQSLIDGINSKNLGWKADVNSKFAKMSVSEAKKLMGVLPKSKDSMVLPAKFPTFLADPLPANYSVVDKFASECPSVTYIKDQSGCGSCWAVSASSAMQDRWCINTPAGQTRDPVLLSADEITGCCGGFTCIGCAGCNGGQLAPAWHFAKTHGIVTGGNYGDDKTCAPYALPPCEHHVSGSRPVCKEGEYKTPSCPRSCKNGADFNSDRHFFQNGYSLPTVDSMMQDIYTHGSIQVAFTVYQDLLTYKEGVYKWDGTSPALGGHAVSIVGWGETAGGDKYWIVRNSWNTDWGNQGYFWIARGIDECGIEDDAHAGLPDYSKSAAARAGKL